MYLTIENTFFYNMIRTNEIILRNISKGWVATVFYIARTHLARPDLGLHAHVCALQFFGDRTSHPHF